jgi:hypothetical protein
MSIYRPSRPLSQRKKPKSKPLIAAWDTETEGLGGRLLAASYAMLNQNGDIIQSGYYALGAANFPTSESISKRIIDLLLANSDFIWYAHNAEYDWRYIIRECAARNLSLDFLLGGQDRVLTIKIDRTETRDSFTLFPSTLKKFSQTYCPESSKLELDLSAQTFDPSNKQHLEYALRDAETLAQSIYRHREFISKNFDCDISVSAPGTALKAFKTTLQSSILSNDNDDAFFRAAYFGGYVAPLSIKQHIGCRTYDINSSYPYAMRTYGAPSGRFYRLDDGSAYDRLKSSPGYWRVRIHAPETIKMPVLPYRTKTGACVWPLGNFETNITNDEINFAESIGYKIEKLNGIVFDTIEYIFSDFVDLCERLRAQYKGRPLENVIKLTQNSLYGKFGTQKLRSSIVKFGDDAESWGNVKPFDLLPGYGIKKENDDDVTCAPHIAAWITAQARLNLFRSAYAGGIDHVLYCDTDSLSVSTEFDATKISIGNAYGQFKLEKTWSKFRAIAPKVYAGQLIDGSWKGACKGIPKPNADDYERLYNGDTIERQYQSMPSFGVWLKNALPLPAQKRSRLSTNPDNVYGWRIQKHSTKISPIILDE